MRKHQSESVASGHRWRDPNIARLALVATLSAAPFAPVLLASFDLLDYAHLPQTHFVRAGLTIVLLLFAVSSIDLRKSQAAWAPIDSAILVILVWAGGSLIWCTNRYEGALTILQWVCAGTVYALVRLTFQGRDHIRMLVTGLTISGTLVALLGIGQHLI